MGDVHGAHRAMLQVLERANFDYDNDTLIFIGDVADGWSEVPECIDEFLKIKNFQGIIGNHDLWLLDWLRSHRAPDIWVMQGGEATIQGYQRYGKNYSEHAAFLASWDLSIIEENTDRLFVHAGLPCHPTQGFQLWGCDPHDLVWTRDLAYSHRALAEGKIPNPPERLQGEFSEIFIGHTSTWSWTDVPVKAAEVWNIDQGAGWYGKLTIMDIDTHEVWQSDVVRTLYPDEFGRRE